MEPIIVAGAILLSSAITLIVTWARERGKDIERRALRERVIAIETRLEERSRRTDARLRDIEVELKSLIHYLRNGRSE